MADFGLVKSFGIDNGEIDGLSPQECFVLGYELAQIDDTLRSCPNSPICIPVHSANRERIAGSCEDAGRRYRFDWMHDDPSESWSMLYVEAE